MIKDHLKFSNASKGAFLEQMGKSGARQFTGIPKEVTARESELENQLESLQAAFVEQSSGPPEKEKPDEMRLLGEHIQQVKGALKALQDEIRIAYPDYYALKYPKSATLSGLQQNVLQPAEIILIFGVMEQTTCLWVVGKDQFQLFTIEIGEHNLQQKVNEFRKVLLAILDAIVSRYPAYGFSNLLQSSMSELRERGHELYGLLVPQAAAEMIAKAAMVYI